jgi:DUF917 family protein
VATLELLAATAMARVIPAEAIGTWSVHDNILSVAYKHALIICCASGEAWPKITSSI